MQRYISGTFHGKRIPTIGADFMTKKITMDNSELILQIWDTAGQERFHQNSLGTSFYRNADGALLVYDVNNEKSFDQVSQWRDEALNKIEPGTYFPIVVLGNKVDIRDTIPLEERIDHNSMLGWCIDNSYGHIETSAKENVGVEGAMQSIAALALEAHRLNQSKGIDHHAKRKSTVRVSELYEQKQPSYCSGCSR